MIADPSSASANLGPLVAGFILGFVFSWLAWSSQITRWRVWAYRRVADIDALKSAAVSASLIWPEGHFFERTEFRSRDQIAEMSQLEMASRIRKAAGILPQEPSGLTRVGTVGKSLVLGMIFMPISVLAPAGVLSFIGIDVTDSPVFLALVVLFPITLAMVIYRRARRDQVSADEAFRRILPRGIRREDGGA